MVDQLKCTDRDRYILIGQQQLSRSMSSISATAVQNETGQRMASDP